MLDKFIHKWLRVPYTLYVRHNKRARKGQPTILFIHGIGNTGTVWNNVIKQLPADVGVVSLDLLGFGKSPKPEWAIYNARRQASSVLATYFRLGLTGKVIIVGHSLGSLVAIEMTKRYPLLIDHLILCSPPFYRPDDETLRLPRHPDAVLRRLGAQVEKYPDQFVTLAAFVMKYNLINKSFTVTPENIHSYMGTLRATILNQTSLIDALKLKVPTEILQGTLDPLVITTNLKNLTKSNPNIRHKAVIAGHEVKGLFVGAVVKSIKKVIEKK